MKPIVLTALGGLSLTFAIAACVPQVAPPPAPPVATNEPAPQPPPTAVDTTLAIEPDWLDKPASPGAWNLLNSGSAQRLAFQQTGQAAPFALQCSGGITRVTADVPVGSTMIVATETATRTFALNQADAETGRAFTELSTRDPFLDAIAFSRGRFAVAVTGQSNVYLPARPAITRFLEECR